MNLYTSKKIICTIGPSIDDKEVLHELSKRGVDIFRINLSHAPLEDIERLWRIGEELGITIGIDTEGAQLRTKIREGTSSVEMKKDEIINLSAVKDTFENEEGVIDLYPKSAINLLEEGDVIRFDFNGASSVVEKILSDHVILRCISAGKIGDNKGADCKRPIELDDFTKKDLIALQIANKLGINHVFVSFCKGPEAILRVKENVEAAIVTSKIESKLSLSRLNDICNYTDALLIDRGDLTREINILDVPFAQKAIIEVANRFEVPCYVATNVLETLISNDLPTRAEINDIASTLQMGAAGLVLAAETAIGKHPILCAEILSEMIHRYEMHKNGLLFADIDRNEITDEHMKLWLNRS